MAVRLYVRKRDGKWCLDKDDGTFSGDVHVKPGTKVYWKCEGTRGQFFFPDGKPFGIWHQVIQINDTKPNAVDINAAPGRYEYKILCDDGTEADAGSPPRAGAELLRQRPPHRVGSSSQRTKAVVSTSNLAYLA